MAIDTELKRKSAETVGKVTRPPIVVPDGTLGQADRQQIGWIYAGILVIFPSSAPVKGPTKAALTTSGRTNLTLTTSGRNSATLS